MSGSIGDTRSRLREETRDLHQALEKQLDLVGPRLTLPRYQEILARFAGFYRVWEGSVRSVASAELAHFLEGREKFPLLRADLACFRVDAESLPVCRSISRPKSFAEALGGLYVLEGSTLGGQIIYKHLEAKLGLTVETGARFFYGYGHHTGRMWKGFENLLERLSRPENAGTTVAAAKDTFQALHTWLEAAV